MKKVKIAAAILVLLFIGGVVAGVLVYNNLGAIVKHGIETYGPRFTGTAVTVDSVELSPKTGRGEIKGLFIANPEGYSTEYAVKCDRIAIEIDVKSLNQDKIIIREITLEAPQLSYEAVLPTGSNLKDLNEHVSAAKPEGTTEAAPDSESKRFQIDRVTLTGGTILVSHKGTAGKGIPVKLPEIDETDIGTGPEGVTIKEAVTRITNALFRSVSAVAISNLPPLNHITDGVKGITDGVKGLFGGKKDDETTTE